jgi:hypothetical protein
MESVCGQIFTPNTVPAEIRLTRFMARYGSLYSSVSRLCNHGMSRSQTTTGMSPWTCSRDVAALRERVHFSR